MFKRWIVPVVAAALMVAPAMAEEPIVLEIVNHSSLTVTALNTFALDKMGAPVEDNLGGLMDDVPPGGSATVELSLIKCDGILALVGLSNDTEARAKIDLCSDAVLVLND